MLYNALPDLFAMKVFGCLCYVSTLKNNRKKHDLRARKCIYLGVKSRVKSYLVYDLKNREIFLSRDVNFYERHFPYRDKANPSTLNPDHVLPYFKPQPESFTDLPEIQPDNQIQIVDNQPATTPNNLTDPIDPPDSPHLSSNPPSFSKPSRNKRPPSYLQDYHCSLNSTTVHD